MRSAAIAVLLPVLAFLILFMELSDRFALGGRRTGEVSEEEMDQDGIGW